MGGGPDSPKDLEGHLLFTLPWPEATAVTDRIRKTYPKLKVTYLVVGERRSREPGEIDDGWFLSFIFLFGLLCSGFTFGFSCLMEGGEKRGRREGIGNGEMLSGLIREGLE